MIFASVSPYHFPKIHAAAMVFSISPKVPGGIMGVGSKHFAWSRFYLLIFTKLTL
jgi:hypothetical protein